MRTAFLFPVILALQANAQTFEQAWRGGGVGVDWITSIAPSPDGAIVFAGALSDSAQLLGVPVAFSGGFIAKVDQNGSLLWAVPAGLGWSALYASPTVAVDDSGHVFATGRYTSSAVVGDTTILGDSTINFFLARFTPDGTLVWAEAAGLSAASTGIDLTPEGDPVVAGFSGGVANIGGTTIIPYGTGTGDIFTARFDRNGVLTWVRQAGGTGFYSDAAYDVAVDDDGNVLVAGQIRNFSLFDPLTLQCTITSPDCSGGFIAKYDAAGIIQWVKNAGMKCFGVDVDASGNVYLTGDHSFDLYFDSILVVGHPGYDHYTAKLDPAGNYQWVLVPPQGDLEITHDIATDTAGTSYVAALVRDTMVLDGITVNEDDWSDYLLYAVGTDGDVQWIRNGEVVAPGTSVAEAVAVGIDCELIAGGAFNTTAPFVLDTTDLGATANAEIWLARLDRCGLSTGEGPASGLPRPTIYPDPATDLIHVNGMEGTVDYEIFNALGIVVARGKRNGTAAIPVSGLQPGAYWLRWIEEGKPSIAVPFIKH